MSEKFCQCSLPEVAHNDPRKINGSTCLTCGGKINFYRNIKPIESAPVRVPSVKEISKFLYDKYREFHGFKIVHPSPNNHKLISIFNFQAVALHQKFSGVTRVPRCEKKLADALEGLIEYLESMGDDGHRAYKEAKKALHEYLVGYNQTTNKKEN